MSSALRWIETQWSKAAQSEDKEGYRALLHEDFKGHAFGASEVIDRASWPRFASPLWAPPSPTACPTSPPTRTTPHG